MSSTVNVSPRARMPFIDALREQSNFWIASACILLAVVAVAMAASAYVNGPVFEAPLIGP